MSYLSATVRALIQSRITKKTAQLALANATYDKLLTQDTEEYRFNSGEGSQWATKRKIAEISNEIETLEVEIDRLNAKLNSGGGLVTFALRRQ